MNHVCRPRGLAAPKRNGGGAVTSARRRGKQYLDYFNLPDVQRALAETGTTDIIEVSESFHLTE